MAETITLVCARCGDNKSGEVDRLPSFGFELVNIAHAAGMVGVLDPHHSRALVFCDDKCMNSSLTKKGCFPARIKCQTKTAVPA